MCVVRALDTRFFTPWLSVARRAPGCSSHGQLGPGGTEVHVIRVLLDRGPSQPTRGWWLAQGLPLIEVILNATPHNSSTAPLALLLSADRPITWRITANGVKPTAKHSLTVRRVDVSTIIVTIKLHPREAMTQCCDCRCVRSARWRLLCK